MLSRKDLSAYLNKQIPLMNGFPPRRCHAFLQGQLMFLNKWVRIAFVIALFSIAALAAYSFFFQPNNSTPLVPISKLGQDVQLGNVKKNLGEWDKAEYHLPGRRDRHLDQGDHGWQHRKDSE